MLSRILSLWILVLALPAEAARIEFVWQSNGQRSIVAAPGDELVLEGRVIFEGDSTIGVGVSALAPVDIVSATDHTVCPNGCGNLMAVGLGGLVLNNQRDFIPFGDFTDPVPGLSGSFAALAFEPEAEDFVLFELRYSVIGIGAGEIFPFYRGGIDGFADPVSGFLLPIAEGADIRSGLTLQIVPEPSTALLFGIGIAGMARRRRPGQS